MGLALDQLTANVKVYGTVLSPDGPDTIVRCSDGEGFELSFNVNDVYAPEIGTKFKVVITREEPSSCFGGH